MVAIKHALPEIIKIASALLEHLPDSGSVSVNATLLAEISAGHEPDLINQIVNQIQAIFLKLLLLFNNKANNNLKRLRETLLVTLLTKSLLKVKFLFQKLLLSLKEFFQKLLMLS